MIIIFPRPQHTHTHIPQELTQQYWDILGRPGSALSLLPNPPPPPPAPSSPPQATSSGGLPGTAVLAAVLGTVGACALLAAAVAMALSVRRANGRRHRNMRGQVLPPGPGAQTTLVITDVQVGSPITALRGQRCSGRLHPCSHAA